MFGNLIYFNKSKIKQYATLMQGENNDIISSLDISSYDTSNYLLTCSQFEKLLRGRNDYYDYVDDTPEVTVKDVKTSSIIRVRGEIYVPEEFDMIHLVEEYKSIFIKAVKSKNEEEKDLIKTVFDSSKMKIPVYCELNSDCDYWLGICKAIPVNLLIDYQDIEDYEGTEFTILAKLEARKIFKDTPLIVYDFYKDFLGLNRALRKQIPLNKKVPFENISVEEDYLSLEILAIY